MTDSAADNNSTTHSTSHDAHAQSDQHRWGEQCGTRMNLFGAAGDVARSIEANAMKLLPPEVTGHLLNAHRELLRAAGRAAELSQSSAQGYFARGLASIDRAEERLRSIHPPRE